MGRIKAGEPHLSPWEGDGASFSTATSRHLKDKNRIAEPIGEGKEREAKGSKGKRRCLPVFSKAFGFVSENSYSQNGAMCI